MKIEYKGRNKEEDRNYCEALITYNEKKEQKKTDKIFDILTEKGWVVEQEEECASIRVSGKDDYNELVEDYKEAKSLTLQEADKSAVY